jgi:hypothetical protein
VEAPGSKAGAKATVGAGLPFTKSLDRMQLPTKGLFMTSNIIRPLNAVVITWSAQSPPANWALLRDEWWHWHIVRSLAGVAALALTVLAVLGAKRAFP